jgi:predicted O-linked N-acetylglucosamine transferase (SPINDLY family)
MSSDHSSLFAAAIAAHRLGNVAEARRLCAVLVKDNKKNVNALHFLGVLEAELGNYSVSIKYFDSALGFHSSSANIHADKGKVLLASRRYDDALVSLRKAVAIDPIHVLALHNIGCAFLILNRSSEALATFDRLLSSAPDYLPALHNKAIALTDLRRYQEAIAVASRALELAPDYAEAFQSRGTAYEHLRQFDKALEDFRHAASLKPDIEYLAGQVIVSAQHCCEWQGEEEAKQALEDSVNEGKRVVTPFAFLGITDSPRLQLACARTYVDDKFSSISPPVWRGKKYVHEKLRVAYVSADIRTHPIAFPIAGLFEKHDRSRFDVFAISVGKSDDSEIGSRIRSAVNFIDAETKSPESIAHLVREMEIDILVDLNGFTEHNRFGIFAYRPAPLQVSFLGYPGTTGAPYIDYLVADRIVIPENERRWYTENIIYMPSSYHVNDDKRTIPDQTLKRSEAGLPESGFIYCCFNSTYKINSFVFQSWMRILRAVEASALWLLEPNAIAMKNLRSYASQAGIDPSRLIFAPRVDALSHLARHHLADLFLDSLPYGAHTTANDALWAGLPVLTRIGRAFPGRVAASLLETICLPELITHSLDEYESLATGLAVDSKRLADLKKRLMVQRQTAPLFNTGLFARQLEAAYAAIYRRHQAAQKPGDIEVDAVSDL